MLKLVADNPTADEPFSMRGQFTQVDDIKRFLTAGRAVFTLRSLKSGVRFTYKVSAPKRGDHGQRFVALLSGPDNETDYNYMGMLDYGKFRLTAKSRLPESAASVQAFLYFLRCVYDEHTLPSTLQVWHEGKCGRCGRTLTVPESIANGIGPECAKRLGA